MSSKRVCKICQVERSVKQFRPDKTNPQGRLYQSKTCLKCKRKQNAVARKKRRALDPEGHRAKERLYKSTPEYKAKVSIYMKKKYIDTIAKDPEFYNRKAKEAYPRHKKRINADNNKRYADMIANNPEAHEDTKKRKRQYHLDIKGTNVHMNLIKKRREDTERLTDVYVKMILVNQDGWKREEVTMPMIECKRSAILIYREMNPNYSLNRKVINT